MFEYNKLSRLIMLLEKQKAGEGKTVKEISKYINLNFIGKNQGGKALNTDYRILNIMNEWKDMFSYSPGYITGIDNIISLVNLVSKYPKIDILDIYNSKNWQELVELRGPVETVIKYRCYSCKTLFYSMGVSGFLDIAGLICDRCGDVYFKSYNDEQVSNCKCGGHYVDGCPHCGAHDAKLVENKSPYWYFSNHRFTRGNGA